MTLSAIKFKQGEMRQRYGHTLDVRDFFEKSSVAPTEAWKHTLIGEYLVAPTEVAYKHEANFTECQHLPVTILAAAYPDFGKIAPLRRNPQYVDLTIALFIRPDLRSSTISGPSEASASRSTRRR